MNEHSTDEIVVYIDIKYRIIFQIKHLSLTILTYECL